MESQRRYRIVFGLSFIAVLIGVPVVQFSVLVFTHELDIGGSFFFWFLTWIMASSVLLQFWVFCRWSGDGPGKVWKPVAILHVLIVLGMYGRLVISLLNTDVPASNIWEPFYWVWGIGSFLLSFWLPLTKPFAFLDIEKNQLRLLVIPGLVFLPELFALLVILIFFTSSKI
jgi:hypothetical protein